MASERDLRPNCIRPAAAGCLAVPQICSPTAAAAASDGLVATAQLAGVRGGEGVLIPLLGDRSIVGVSDSHA